MLETEHAGHDQRRREHRHACGIVDRGQAFAARCAPSRHALADVPGDIGDRAQHRIEHDGARHLVSAEGAADRAVIVGEEEQRAPADRLQDLDIGGRPVKTQPTTR